MTTDRGVHRASASGQLPMIARTVLPVACAFAVANVLLLCGVRASGIEHVPVDLQTRSMYRARLAGFFARAAPERSAVLLGDSLVFGAHLQASEGELWHRKTLSAGFERAARSRTGFDVAALNLGVNGILFSDLACVAEDVLARRPSVLIVGLSPRPFSSDFAEDGGESARDFLCPKEPSGPFERIRVTASELAGELVPAYRYRDLLQFGALGTTPRAFARSAVLSRLSRPKQDAAAADPSELQDEDAEEERAVLAEMVQRMRAAQRYNSIEIRDDHPQARALAQLLTLLGTQRSTRVLVFYLKENVTAISGQLDLEHYARVSARFAELVRAGLTGAERARFVAIDSDPFAGEYVDHIHLTAKGYTRLAEHLAAELPP